jgi:hypothetical protein
MRCFRNNHWRTLSGIFWGSVVAVVISILCLASESYGKGLVAVLWFACLYTNAFLTNKHNQELELLWLDKKINEKNC